MLSQTPSRSVQITKPMHFDWSLLPLDCVRFILSHIPVPYRMTVLPRVSTFFRDMARDSYLYRFIKEDTCLDDGETDDAILSTEILNRVLIVIQWAGDSLMSVDLGRRWFENETGFGSQLMKCLLASRSFTHLRSLSLRNTMQTLPAENLVEFLSQCHSLQHLDLSGFWSCDDHVLIAIFKASGLHLERLVLEQGFDVTWKSISLVWHYCPRLVYLQLHHCTNITWKAFVPRLSTEHGDSDDESSESDDEIDFQPSITHPLKYLDVGYNRHLDRRALSALAHLCPTLQYLQLSNCTAIDNTGLRYFAHHSSAWRQLQSLDLSGCYLLTDETVCAAFVGETFATFYLDPKWHWNTSRRESFLFDAPDRPLSPMQLRSLDLSFCTLLTDRTLAAVLESCPYLETIHLESCSSMTTLGFQRLKWRGAETEQDCYSKPIALTR